MVLSKKTDFVIPAKGRAAARRAGIQALKETLDYRSPLKACGDKLRGNDGIAMPVGK